MPVVQDLNALLENSAANDDFKQAVRDLQNGKVTPLIKYGRGIPPVKALRGISKLLEEAPELKINNLEIDGTSGCSDFIGTMRINDGESEFSFKWDCAWRAEQEGYRDYFGQPDQIRAAREFGYQCFERFARVK